MSERGFWHSFAAILLTLPAYVVSLALERARFGVRFPAEGSSAICGSISSSA